MKESIWFWLGFGGIILVLLAVDLGIFHRRPHVVSIRESLLWTAVWIGLALVFNGAILLVEGHQPALEFLTGFIIEKSLSVDNIFVFALVFSYFSVPREYQHKVLFWGIIGAAGMRLALILVGTALIERFHWVIYLFGVFLIYAGLRMAFGGEERVDPERNPVVRWARRLLPVTDGYRGDDFIVRESGRLMITPLVIVLIVVETTDVLFALDSIPAIFAVTTDAFIVFTSNIFAILGLRALYFALAGMLEKFRFLKHGLAVVLSAVGVKMLLSEVVDIPTWTTLVVILGVLIVSVAGSLIRPPPGVQAGEDETGDGAPPSRRAAEG